MICWSTTQARRRATVSVEHELPAVEHELTTHLERRLEHHDVEMYRHRDRAPDPGTGAEGDVDRAEDLLVLEDVPGQAGSVVCADAELGQVRAVVAVLLKPF